MNISLVVNVQATGSQPSERLVTHTDSPSGECSRKRVESLGDDLDLNATTAVFQYQVISSFFPLTSDPFVVL